MLAQVGCNCGFTGCPFELGLGWLEASRAGHGGSRGCQKLGRLVAHGAEGGERVGGGRGAGAASGAAGRWRREQVARGRAGLGLRGLVALLGGCRGRLRQKRARAPDEFVEVKVIVRQRAGTLGAGRGRVSLLGGGQRGAGVEIALVALLGVAGGALGAGLLVGLGGGLAGGRLLERRLEQILHLVLQQRLVVGAARGRLLLVVRRLAEGGQRAAQRGRRGQVGARLEPVGRRGGRGGAGRGGAVGARPERVVGRHARGGRHRGRDRRRDAAAAEQARARERAVRAVAVVPVGARRRAPLARLGQSELRERVGGELVRLERVGRLRAGG